MSKKRVYLIVCILVVGFFISCALQGRTIAMTQTPIAEIIFAPIKKSSLIINRKKTNTDRPYPEQGVFIEVWSFVPYTGDWLIFDLKAKTLTKIHYTRGIKPDSTNTAVRHLTLEAVNSIINAANNIWDSSPNVGATNNSDATYDGSCEIILFDYDKMIRESCHYGNSKSLGDLMWKLLFAKK